MIDSLGCSAADRVLSRLNGVRAAGNCKWIARCPGHYDRAPSLSIRQLEDRLLIHCHAGCDTRTIVAAIGLGLGDLFDGTTHPRHHDANTDLRKRAAEGLRRWLDAETQHVAEELRGRDNLARAVHDAVASGVMSESQAWDNLARAYVGYSEVEHYFDRLLRADPLTLWREAQHG